MAYNKINWKNDYTPAINQDNLNYMDNGIYNAHKIIQTLLTGENYLGVFTPELALEYPATAVKGDSYYIGSLPASGYTFTTGTLIGAITYNGDKIVYTGTEWSLVEHNEIIIGNVHTIEELLSVDNVVNTAVIVDGYTTQNDGNGGIFNWQDDVDKSTADGVDIVDPTVSIANQGTGIGLGCWIRLVIPQVFDERAAKKTENLNGFNIYDAHTVVEVSFDDATRTLSIGRKLGVTDYEIYCDNILYTINQDFTFTIDDTEGLFFIYFADGVLTHTHTFSYDLLLKHSLVAIGYWSVALQKGRVNFECHSAWYPSWLHILLHLRDGATYESGINITATVDGDGSSDDHIRFSSTSGYAQDEDLRNPIETKAITTNVANYYRAGTDDWLWVEDPDCVVLNTGVPVYNAWSGTAWSLTQMTDGYYGVALLAVHPSVNGDSYVVIMGENQYANIADATEAAGVRPNTDGLPAPEYRFLEARVFKYDSTYTNAKKCSWVSLDTGKEYVDWRYTNGLGAAGGGLGAISSDDVINSNTYANFTLATPTQEGFNQAVDDAFTRKYMIIEEQKPYNQAGGDAVAGINVRKLNTVTQNNITGASLNATTGVFTLPAGTYKLRATAEASRVDAHQLLVKNITNNIVYAGIEAATTTVIATPSTVEAIFTITALTEFRLEHDCKTAQTVYGLGGFSTPTTNTYVNVFSRVSIQQLGA